MDRFDMNSEWLNETDRVSDLDEHGHTHMERLFSHREAVDPMDMRPMYTVRKYRTNKRGERVSVLTEVEGPRSDRAVPDHDGVDCKRIRPREADPWWVLKPPKVVEILADPVRPEQRMSAIGDARERAAGSSKKARLVGGMEGAFLDDTEPFLVKKPMMLGRQERMPDPRNRSRGVDLSFEDPQNPSVRMHAPTTTSMLGENIRQRNPDVRDVGADARNATGTRVQGPRSAREHGRQVRRADVAREHTGMATRIIGQRGATGDGLAPTTKRGTMAPMQMPGNAARPTMGQNAGRSSEYGRQRAEVVYAKDRFGAAHGAVSGPSGARATIFDQGVQPKRGEMLAHREPMGARPGQGASSARVSGDVDRISAKKSYAYAEAGGRDMTAGVRSVVLGSSGARNTDYSTADTGRSSQTILASRMSGAMGRLGAAADALTGRRMFDMAPSQRQQEAASMIGQQAWAASSPMMMQQAQVVREGSHSREWALAESAAGGQRVAPLQVTRKRSRTLRHNVDGSSPPVASRMDIDMSRISALADNPFVIPMSARVGSM